VRSLDEFRAVGGFVDDRLVEREITFSIDGEGPYEAVVFVKKLSIGEHERVFLREEAGKKRSRMAHLISECVTLGAKGEESIPFEDAYKLHPELGRAMMDAIGEVNKRIPDPKA
jgi:hypothetical protein